MTEADVDRFLWDVEAALSHLDGDERLALVREAERLLHVEAARIAAEEAADDVTWYHYVQASAEVGPPERLAVELSGAPPPDRRAAHKRMWIVAWSLVAITLLMLTYAWFTQGDLETVGTWSGEESATSGQRVLHFNVSEEADRVFLSIVVVPNAGNSSAGVTILDGGLNTVYRGAATVGDRIDTVRYVEGEPGHWRILVDFRDFTGGWRASVRQEL